MVGIERRTRRPGVVIKEVPVYRIEGNPEVPSTGLLLEFLLNSKLTTLFDRR